MYLHIILQINSNQLISQINRTNRDTSHIPHPKRLDPEQNLPFRNDKPSTMTQDRDLP